MSDGLMIDHRPPLHTDEAKDLPNIEFVNVSDPTRTQQARLENLVEQVLDVLGLDLSDEHFLETPRRVASMLQEFRQEVDLVALLKSGFTNSATQDAMIVQTGIPIAGSCSHHLAPWTGKVHIGYLPNHRICGLSKLTRVSQAAGKIKPSTQEAVTNLIADTLHEGLDPKGVIVVTRATHGCMSVRGVCEPGVETVVSAVRGVFLTNSAARQEFFELVRLNGQLNGC